MSPLEPVQEGVRLDRLHGKGMAALELRNVIIRPCTGGRVEKHWVLRRLMRDLVVQDI